MTTAKKPKPKDEPQGKLLDTPEPPRIPAIQNGRIAVHFVRFVADRSKDRNRVVFLDFSMELEDAHAGHLPREIEDAWKYLKRGSVKSINPDGIGSQNLAVSLAPEGAPDLSVVAAVPKATVSRIVKKGEGKERRITRLQIRFLTSYTKDVEHLCANAYDETVWLKIKASQRSFGEEEEED